MPDGITFYVHCISCLANFNVKFTFNSLQAINKDRKLFLVSLYFLIWGEAANVRFLPECICYIFHHVSHFSLLVDQFLDQVLCYIHHGTFDKLLNIMGTLFHKVHVCLVHNKNQEDLETWNQSEGCQLGLFFSSLVLDRNMFLTSILF